MAHAQVLREQRGYREAAVPYKVATLIARQLLSRSNTPFPLPSQEPFHKNPPKFTVPVKNNNDQQDSVGLHRQEKPPELVLEDLCAP